MEQHYLRTYLLYHLHIAIDNVLLVGVDADTEHLHKLRTSLRRIRSLIALFAPDYYAFSDSLKLLFKQTNTLRELDVFLAGLDAARYPGLAKKITTYREKCFATLWKKKRARHFDATLRFLYGEIANLQIHEDAQVFIALTHRYYADTFKALEQLEKTHTNKKMHTLRIAFKNLRYALEFLHDQGLENHTEHIRRCKVVQDHLGLIQDASNQLDWLETYCDRHPSKECKALIAERISARKKLKKSAANISLHTL
jgi:CHAD domain-containing protein